MAVLPQFIPPGSPHLAVGLLLAFVHSVEGMVWFTGITGTTLIAFGVRLGLTHR